MSSKVHNRLKFSKMSRKIPNWVFVFSLSDQAPGSCKILLLNYWIDFQVHSLMKAHSRFWKNWKNPRPSRMWKQSKVECWLTWRMLIHMVRCKSDSLRNVVGTLCCFLTYILKFLLHWFRCWWNEITSFVKCSESFSRSRIMGV